MGIIRNLIHDVVVPALQPTPQQAGAPPSEQAKVGATDVAK